MADADISPTAILALLFLIFATLTLIRFVFVVFSMWAFAVGLGIGYLLLRNCKQIPNLLLLLQITGSIKTPKASTEVKIQKKKGCTVCSKKGCTRHRPEVSRQILRPWESLKIPKPVDQALTEFLEITLRTHLYSWYWDLSHDQVFVDEIRDMLRYALSVLLERMQKTNLTDFILRKCIRKFLIHVDCFFRAKERVPLGGDIQATVIDRLKTYRHFAIQNELAEEEYLRYLIQTLEPHLLPANALESKSCNYFLEELLSGVILKPLVEKIAEPDFVNQMLLIFLDKETIPEPNYPPSEKVEFLSEFGKHRRCHTTSALNVSSYDLMHNSTFLYSFMQFMKREGSLNLLQFCLAVEGFNKRSLAPELTEEEQTQVKEEAQEIDALYFKKDAVDMIDFPEEVVKEFQEAIRRPNNAINRLHTATPLFLAYEHAVNVLDKTYVPLFHQSEEFYSLLCGDKMPKKRRIAETNLAKRKFMPFNQLSKLASKIKVKKQQDRDGRLFENDEYDSPAEEGVEAFDGQYNDAFEDPDGLDDGGGGDDDDQEGDGKKFDLSYWHITIPKIDYLLERNKKTYVFILNVEKLGYTKDIGNASWEVVRKYNEFYVLHDKLKRFHDSFNEAELPAKRTILKKDFEYLNSIRFRLQEYLQRLVRSPLLRSSSLVHSFLTPGQQIDGMFEPDSVGKEAGRKVNSLKSKLVIEKGQNLESFLNSYLLSAEPPVKKKVAAKGPILTPGTHRRSNSRMYLPPPAWARDHRRNLSSSSEDSYISTTSYSVTDYILYAARNFFRVSPWLHHILTCLQYIGKETLDAFVNRYVTYKLSLVTAEQQMVKYIHLVRDVIFFDNDPPRTDSDKVERRDKTLEELMVFLPETVKTVIGVDYHDNAMKTLFEMFQQPKLNKQLAYILLDEVLLELFPELKSKVDDPLGN